MYKKPIVLNSITHRSLKVASVSNYDFAKAINSCVVLGQEFLEAAKCYPIVFSKSEDGVITPVVILGIKENLFVDSDGKWEAGTYIPAFIRRYPYILAEGLSQDGSLTVCIDSDYSGFNAEDGERLFTDKGENTTILNNIIEFLRLYHNQFEITKVFMNHIKDLNILKAVDANITLTGGQSFTIRNLLMVDENALHKLSDGDLVTLVRRGYMPWIYAHLYSLTNFNKIINKAGNVVSKKED